MPVLLANGNMLAPRSAEADDGTIGDFSEEITPESDEYARSIPWLKPADRKRAEALAAQARQKAAA